MVTRLACIWFTKDTFKIHISRGFRFMNFVSIIHPRWLWWRWSLSMVSAGFHGPNLPWSSDEQWQDFPQFCNNFKCNISYFLLQTTLAHNFKDSVAQKSLLMSLWVEDTVNTAVLQLCSCPFLHDTLPAQGSVEPTEKKLYCYIANVSHPS